MHWRLPLLDDRNRIIARIDRMKTSGAMVATVAQSTEGKGSGSPRCGSIPVHDASMNASHKLVEQFFCSA